MALLKELDRANPGKKTPNDDTICTKAMTEGVPGVQRTTEALGKLKKPRQMTWYF